VRFAADQTFEAINEVSLHKDGLPIRVGHLMDWLTSKNINDRRAAIHVLDIIKLCEVQGDDPTVDSIVNTAAGSDEVTNSFIGETLLIYGRNRVDKCTSNRIIHHFRSELERMFPSRNQLRRLEELRELNDIHMSVRKGPNGPALGMITKDFVSISKSGLLDPIIDISKQCRNTELLAIIDELKTENERELGPGYFDLECIDSRLAIKVEPWGKTRYFAICDWFSQSALKGLHKWIFSWLSKQVEDGTMSQDSVAETVRLWTGESVSLSPESVDSVGKNPHANNIYSLDLSKATDRLPATLQREILQHMFGKPFSDKWYSICTDRVFSRSTGAPISFQVGQPLGVYSSWAMLALTHHVVCRTAMRLSGMKRDGKNPHYVVIGDDVAMVGDQLAEWYTKIMHTILQVDISPIKGFTPNTSLGKNSLSESTKSLSAEIAKRIFVNGKELSVVTPETLKSAWEYPADYPSLLRQLQNRGCFSPLNEAVAPLALAAPGFKPDTACIFATFPLRPGVSKETLKAVCENYGELLAFIPWHQSEIPISESELETMFRWSVRSSLQSTLNKFKDQFQIYLDVSRKPIQCGDRVYHSKVLEYVTRLLLNKAMLLILELVVETNALNFQGPGQKLDEIASALNTMADFDLALRGKPINKRENLHRLRSRVITKLQPFVLKTVQKAKEYFGILLLDAGEHVEFVPKELIDIDHHNLETRDLLVHESSKLAHDAAYLRHVEVVKRRTMEVMA
jgi:hypothetical protein